MPSGRWKPHTMPSADNSASRLPDSTVIGTPQAASARSMKAGPLRASRQAAVAMAHTLPTPMASQRARNRRSAASARSTESAASRPVVSTSRPRPARIFSLKTGVWVRARRS